MVDKTSAECVTVETTQQIILASPIAAEGTRSDEEGLDVLRANIRWDE
jgi:hypothetical protein